MTTPVQRQGEFPMIEIRVSWTIKLDLTAVMTAVRIALLHVIYG
ncbi:hypothetical protein [Microbacterium album]|nr:hypothetical protein [Microbacterium album]